MSTQIPDFYAIIPAGGAGTRLWPLSRQSAPKFLLDLTGTGRSLLQGTWDRLTDLATEQYLVTGGAHAAGVARQLPQLPAENLLVEPLPRDSAAAIGLAAAIIAHRHPGAIVGSFAADQVIANQQVFDQVVRQAAVVARTGALVTIGIDPTHPATGFGYIKAGADLGLAEAPDAVQVVEFVEKPAAELATEYLRTGQYRWNAGMFVAQADTILQLLAQYQPALAADLATLAKAWDTPERAEQLAQLWPGITKIAIDYAIAEPAAAAGRVAMVAGNFGWNDIGDFAALTEVLPPSDGLTQFGASPVISIDSTGFVAAMSGRTITVLGLEDVVVVDTPDALLITHKAAAQQVKKVVDALGPAGLEHLR